MSDARNAKSLVDKGISSFSNRSFETKHACKTTLKIRWFIRLAVVHFAVIFLLGIYPIGGIKTRSSGLVVIDQRDWNIYKIQGNSRSTFPNEITALVSSPWQILRWPEINVRRRSKHEQSPLARNITWRSPMKVLVMGIWRAVFPFKYHFKRL